MIASLKTLLAIPYFPRLLLARTISNLGNGISPVALAFGVLSITGAQPSDLSAVMAARTFPILIMLVVGGAIADRYGRAKAMGITDLTLGFLIIISALSFILAMPSVLLLIVIGVLAGLLNGIWYPAFSGLMPVVVPKEHLQNGNAVVGFGSNIAFLLGTAAGGILIATVGVGWAILIDGLTFIVAGIMIMGISKLPQKGVGEEAKVTLFKDIKLGWGEFISRPWIWVIVFAFSFINLAFEAAYAVLGPLQSKEAYDGAPSWAWVLGALSFGMLLGSLVAMKVRPKRPLLVAMLGLLPLPLMIGAMGQALPLTIVIVFAVLAGIGLDVFYVLWMTSLQNNVPEEALSRVTSYDAFGSFIFGPLGIAIAGPLAMIFGVSETLLIGALIAMIFILIPMAVPAVSRLRSAPTAS
ncbi:MAG: MFS transporter [Actinomycetota bacterium]